jgi:hypothetical protein
MKTLTASDVLAIATDLIASTNSDITTLDIKKEARNRGFFAKQSDVSMMTQELIREDRLEVKGDNGTFRFYNLPVNAPATASSITTAGVTVKKHDGTLLNINSIAPTSATTGDWEATDSNGTSAIFFNGVSFTRDEVRCAFSKMTGAAYVDTRAKRIK